MLIGPNQHRPCDAETALLAPRLEFELHVMHLCASPFQRVCRAADSHVVALGSPCSEDHLGGVCANQCGDGRAGCIEDCFGLLTEMVDGGCVAPNLAHRSRHAVSDQGVEEGAVGQEEGEREDRRQRAVRVEIVARSIVAVVEPHLLEAGNALARDLEEHFPMDYEIVGFVEDNPIAGTENGWKILGRSEEIAELVRFIQASERGVVK